MAKHKLNVLVVDDDDDVRTLIADILQTEGHTVVCAEDGNSGLEAAQVAVFDVALVDYHMPAPNGLEVLARLHRSQPNCVCLLVSGGLDVPIALEAINRGEAARIVAKPFTAGELLAAIEEAVDKRQRMGEQFLWTNAMEHSVEERHLRDCFQRNLFRLALQPIVASDSHAVFAHEALLRCDHPVLATPIAVLQAAERHGQMPQLSAAVMAQCAAALKDLPEPLKLFVNLHPNELEDPDSLLQRVGALKQFAARIVLEITERSQMIDAEHWRVSIGRLTDAGFSLAVDDLGAGYSSLSVLAEIKPQFIKIDMSIVRNCHADGHKQRLIELLCRFGETTSARVIAEGIETEAEAAVVAKAGAHYMQGYLFGKPQLVAAKAAAGAKR